MLFRFTESVINIAHVPKECLYHPRKQTSVSYVADCDHLLLRQRQKLLPLMSPTLLVEFGLKAFRHPRCRIIVGSVAPWTGRSGTAATAGMFAFPWSSGMAFTNPAAVLAEGAIHGAGRTIFLKSE